MAGQIEAGKAVVRVEANRSWLAAGLAAAQKELKSFAAGAAKIGGGALAGSAAVLAPLTAAVKHFADTGSELSDMSQRTGASVEALSGLGYAAKMTGAELGDVEKGLLKMQKGLTAGDDGFADLGISIEKLKGFAPEDQMRMIATEIAKLETPAEKTAAAMAIFGKGGAALLPMMADGAKGIDMMVAEASALGVVMSGESAASADVLGDSIDKMTIAGGSLAKMLAAQLAPAFLATIAFVTYGITTTRDWVEVNQGLVISVAAVAVAVSALGAALVVAGGAAYAASVAIGIFGAAPLIALGALTALTGYLIYASDAGGQALDFLGEKFTMLSEIAGPVFKGIQDAMSGGDFALAADILWAGVQIAWIKGTSEISSMFSLVLDDMLGQLDGWIASFRSAWNTVIGRAADLLTDFFGILGLADAEGIKKMRQEDTATQNQGFASGVNDRAAGRDAAAIAAEQAGKERIAALNESLLKSLGKAVVVANDAEAKKLAIAGYKKQGDASGGIKGTIAEFKTKGSENLGTSSGFAAMLQSMGSGQLTLDQQMYTEAKIQSQKLGEILKALLVKASPIKQPEFE